ncbi:DUF4185 domain-containing protein [Tessaracoccus sp. OS52]|uniref:DUF4185 domain-containing protein n=1 Tax=Tessaracoccus sp. OS52 TaxID=2886691 RepID=UPI001D12FEFF|nr:DUF4185 domain-containing protein [Tessaracoccus sp. OS52]MCC2594288.1 DUF4185 domain-containing protein [Tessaracoccus sp. OS52]
MVSRRTLLTAGAVAPLLTACGSEGIPNAVQLGDDFVLERVDAVTQLAQLTGPGAMNDTVQYLLEGADLGHMTTVGDRTYFVFGDNFGLRDPDTIGAGGEVWKSNCIAFTTDDDPADGITFDGWILDDLGQVKEVIPGDHKPNDQVGEVTKIPTQMWAVGDALFMGYMSVHHWGEPGAWTADHAGVARSLDDAQTWEIIPGLVWAGDSNFIQLAHAHVVEAGDTYVYLWGIPAGRFGGVKLMRVRADADAVVDLGAYEYFSGLADDLPSWSKEESDAVTVLDASVGELSVLWSEHLGRWLLTTMVDNGSAVVFEGLAPWGPWSQPHTITTQGETPGLYAPYTNPRYVSGERVYFTLSIWNPYQVFWYSMDLVKRGG